MEQRLERKYIINKNISSTDFVNLFNGYFKETYKERIVNSIYFDNPESLLDIIINKITEYIGSNYNIKIIILESHDIDKKKSFHIIFKM